MSKSGFVRRFFRSAALAAVATGTGCAAVPDDGASESASAASRDIKGLFVIDGTGVADCAKDRGWTSNIKDLELLWQTNHHFCGNGSNLLGTNVGEIYGIVIGRICQAARAEGLGSLYLAGYSRGAIIALTIARSFYEVPTLCGPGTSVRPAWIGLMDAVDTSMDSGWARAIPRPGGIPMPNIHIVKADNGWTNTVLTTRSILFSNEEVAQESTPGSGDNRRHENIDWNWRVLARLVESAREAGAPLPPPWSTKLKR